MESKKPKKLQKALIIIWVCFFIVVLQTLFSLPGVLKNSPSEGASFFVMFLIFGTMGFQVLIMWLIGRGKNWARWFLLIWSVVAQAMSLGNLATEIVKSPLTLIFSTVVAVVNFVGIAMLFQAGADEYFRKPALNPPQD